MAAKKIQYSVTMRPNPIHEGDPMKAYANIQLAGHYSTEDLCEHVISHNSTFSEGTVSGILTDMVKCIRELLLQGYSVQVGSLGRLEPSIKSTGAVSIEKFSEDNIDELNLIFTHSKDTYIDYGFDGFCYVTPLDDINFKRETVFTRNNGGWFPAFMGKRNNHPVISAFSPESMSNP